jgi:hypothetical protein
MRSIKADATRVPGPSESLGFGENRPVAQGMGKNVGFGSPKRKGRAPSLPGSSIRTRLKRRDQARRRAEEECPGVSAGLEGGPRRIRNVGYRVNLEVKSAVLEQADLRRRKSGRQDCIHQMRVAGALQGDDIVLI